MTLETLLPVLDEYTVTKIIDTDTLIQIAVYDGRNNIPSALNDRKIDYITASDNTIRVYVF